MAERQPAFAHNQQWTDLCHRSGQKTRLIYDTPNLYWMSLSKDNRWIYVSHQADEGDIWLATLK